MLEQVHDFGVAAVERMQAALHDISVQAKVVGGLAVGLAAITLLETAGQKAARLRAMEAVQPVGTRDEQRMAAKLARARGHAEDVEAGLVEEDAEQYEGL